MKFFLAVGDDLRSEQQQVQAHCAFRGFLRAWQPGREKRRQQSASAAFLGASANINLTWAALPLFDWLVLKLSHPKVFTSSSYGIDDLPVECAEGAPDVKGGRETFIFLL